MSKQSIYKIFLCFLSVLLMHDSYAYAVLTHEALIDASWEQSILPLLKKRFPRATEPDIKDAKAYAYGGAVAPDMGYYPFGNIFFTDLVHYVRSGDMVDALFEEATSLNQLAFAIGFLCHYNADKYGHSIATNRSVPLVYPKVRAKYGDLVTYAEDKASHQKMEFAFDVFQTARGTYASKAYHDYIGFKVDTEVLARAFQKTYGLALNEVFHHHLELAVETFRWAVKDLFPLLTKAAWASKKQQIHQNNPSATSRSFSYRMHRKDYIREFGKSYKHPGFIPTVISFFIRILPKIGPMRALKFKAPTEQAEKYFVQSFDTVISHYTTDLGILRNRVPEFANIDFDTGHKTNPGEYSLADETYEKLLLKLREAEFSNLTTDLKKNLLNYFNKAQNKTGNTKDAEEIQQALKALKMHSLSLKL